MSDESVVHIASRGFHSVKSTANSMGDGTVHHRRGVALDELVLSNIPAQTLQPTLVLTEHSAEAVALRLSWADFSVDPFAGMAKTDSFSKCVFYTGSNSSE